MEFIVAILTGLLVLVIGVEIGVLIWLLFAAAAEREKLLDRIQAPTFREYRQAHPAPKPKEPQGAPVDGRPIEMEIEDMAPGVYPEAEEAGRRLME